MSTVATVPTKLHLFVGPGRGAVVCELLSLRPVDEPWALVSNEPGLLNSDVLVNSGVNWRELLGGCACCMAASSPILRTTLAQMIKVRPKPVRLLLVLSADAEPLRIVPMLAQYFGKAAPLESVVHCTSLEAHAAARLNHDDSGVDDGNSSSNKDDKLALEGPNLKYRSQFEAADVIIGLPSRAALATTPGLIKPSVRLALEKATDLDASYWDANVGVIFNDEIKAAATTVTTEGSTGAAGHWVACGPPKVSNGAAGADSDASGVDNEIGSWRHRVDEQPTIPTVDCNAVATPTPAITTRTVTAMWVIPQEQPFNHEAMPSTARAVLLAAAVYVMGGGASDTVPTTLPSPLPLDDVTIIEGIRVTCVLRSSRGGFHLLEAKLTAGTDMAQLRKESIDLEEGGTRVKITLPRAYEHRWPWSRIEVAVDYNVSGEQNFAGQVWNAGATAAVEIALRNALHLHS